MNEPDIQSKSQRAMPVQDAKRLRWLLLVASVLFLFGIFMPMITISKFIFISHSFSIASGLFELLRNGQLILFIVVSGFSIVLPIMKVGILFRLLSTQAEIKQRIKRYLQLMHDYGRWAMLDVMVVAILIVTVKLGFIASIEVHSGLYVFGSSVLLIMYITHKIVHLTS
jgi:paraquat-inducible protein A